MILTIQAVWTVTRNTVAILVNLFKNCFWVVWRWLNSEHFQSYAVVFVYAGHTIPLSFSVRHEVLLTLVRQVDMCDLLQSQFFFNSYVDLKKIPLILRI